MTDIILIKLKMDIADFEERGYSVDRSYRTSTNIPELRIMLLHLQDKETDLHNKEMNAMLTITSLVGLVAMGESCDLIEKSTTKNLYLAWLKMYSEFQKKYSKEV
jgi:hypothetical protein